MAILSFCYFEEYFFYWLLTFLKKSIFLSKNDTVE